MTFLEMQTEVFRHSGMESSDTTNATSVKFWINLVQRDISGRWPWSWLKSREVIQTVPDYTTGTVSVSAAGTTVTGSGTTFVAGMVGRFIQFQGTNDWYKITVVGGTTSLTIEAAYAPTTSLSAGTYIIRKFFYSLSSSADRIYDIKNWNTPTKLVQVDAYTLDDLRPNPQSTGPTSAYNMWGYDSSGNIVLQLYPMPNDIRNLEIRTLIRVTDLSASGDLSIIPVKWHQAITFGANALAFAYLRKLDLSQFWAQAFDSKIASMIAQERPSNDDQPVLKSIDSVSRGNFVRMPDQYSAGG